MKYELSISENGEAHIQPYESTDIFKRGYEMGEFIGMRNYKEALMKVINLSEIDRKALVGYTTIEAVISGVDPQKLVGVTND